MNLTRVYIPDIIISQVGLMHQGLMTRAELCFVELSVK